MNDPKRHFQGFASFTRMVINQKKCVACGNCVAVCPMGAIYIEEHSNRAQINDDACVECGTCHRGMSTEKLEPHFCEDRSGDCQVLSVSIRARTGCVPYIRDRDE